MEPTLKHLPKEITSYDLLKSFAIITMIIDHIGFYFFPDQMGWRIVGRMSLPVWMFLIGYANTREIPAILWAGGAALLVGNIVVGMPVFPLNILFTIAVIRLLLDMVMQFTRISFQYLFLAVFAMALLVFPTMFLVEYGTQALLFAMFGYYVRHQAKVGFSNEAILVFMGVILFIFIFFQKVSLGMDNIEFLTMGAGVLLVCMMLSQFKRKIYPVWTAKLPKIVVAAIKLMGHRTLEIYVIHLLLFKVAGLWLFPARFPLFDFHLF